MQETMIVFGVMYCISVICWLIALRFLLRFCDEGVKMLVHPDNSGMLVVVVLTPFINTILGVVGVVAFVFLIVEKILSYTDIIDKIGSVLRSIARVKQ